jgi:hypothetical protein
MTNPLISIHLDNKFLSHLSGLNPFTKSAKPRQICNAIVSYNETTFRHQDSFKKAKPNSVGLINWLRQPGQLSNRLQKSIRVKSSQLIKSCGTRTDPAAETKSVGLPADALVPCFLLATWTILS